MIFRFGRFELDDEAGELRRAGSPVEVQPKPLALLFLLVRQRDRVVSSEEIFAALWPGVVVTPGSLTRAVSLARRAIEDTHRGEILRSVPRRGYRFSADVVVSGASSGAAGPTPGAPAGAPFVGRDAMLGILRRRFAAAAEGRGGLVLVRGAAGIGKTRLCEVFLAEAQRAGGLVLVGRSHEGEGVPGFWPWAQILRRLGGTAGGADLLEELGGAAAELAALVPGIAVRDPAPAQAVPAPEQRRFLLFEAVVRVLVRAAALRPVVLLIEDLQWAGHESLHLLEHVAFDVADHPLLVLATIRDENRDPLHPLERTLPNLRRHPSSDEIALSELSRADVASLLEQTIGRPAPADLTSELYARTEGVPLFLREAIRLLADRGDLRHPEGVRRWGITLPLRSFDLIRRPLERLSPSCADLVGAAAVLGREFATDLAADVAAMERETALGLLDEATRNGVVEPVEDAPGGFRFTHALFREAAHQGLGAGVRARYHQRAAEALERRHRDDVDRVISELAHHHHESLALGDPERAFGFAWRAAERASRLLAHEQAALHYAHAVQALDRCDPPDPDRRLEALLALGQAQRLAADRTGRRATFSCAMEAAEALGRPVEMARAAIGFCDLSEWAPRDEVARSALQRALGGLPASAMEERARILTRIGHLSARDDVARAEPVAREALALARQAGDPEALLDAIYGLHFLLAGPDHLAEREELAREAEPIVRSAGATDTSIILFLDFACDRLTLGDAEGARERRQLAGEIAGADPHPGRAWHIRVYDTGVALLEGRLGEAGRLREEASRLGVRIAHPYGRGVSRGAQAVAARVCGDEEKVLESFDPRLPVRQGPVHWVQAFSGRALAAVGRRQEAMAFLDDLVSTPLQRIPRNIRWHAAISEVAHLVADLEDAERAGQVLPLLSPLPQHHAVLPLFVGYGGPFRFAIGRLLALLGRLEEAREELEEAAAAAAALGARPARVRILLELAGILSRRGETSAAREARADALDLAVAIGEPRLEAAVRAAAS